MSDENSVVQQEEQTVDNINNGNEDGGEDILQQEIDQLTQAEEQAKQHAQSDFGPLLKKIKDLESQLQEKEEIARNSQINYLHLKADFDILQRQTQQKMDNVERDATLRIVKDLLPFVENLRKSLLSLTDEQKASSIGEGLQIMYDNFLKSLEKLGIKPINAIGLEPDPLYHEPVNLMAVEDEGLKGKIVQEFQQGFVYEQGDEKIVVIPSKVIVGN